MAPARPARSVDLGDLIPVPPTIFPSYLCTLMSMLMLNGICRMSGQSLN